MNCIIDDYFALNYVKRDKDNLVHILTEVDPRQCKHLKNAVSPTAQTVITSEVIASFLFEKFGFICLVIPFNKKNRLSVNSKPGDSYSLTFIESKHSPGSFGVLIEGPFGTALYTGTDKASSLDLVPVLVLSTAFKTSNNGRLSS